MYDNPYFIARFMRIIASCVALLVGLVSSGICWGVLEMKNVYFRPVSTSVETGEGDPYMIALNCVAGLSGDLETPLITLTLSMLALFVLAVRNKHSLQSG